VFLVFSLCLGYCGKRASIATAEQRAAIPKNVSLAELADPKLPSGSFVRVRAVVDDKSKVETTREFTLALFEGSSDVVLYCDSSVYKVPSAGHARVFDGIIREGTDFGLGGAALFYFLHERLNREPSQVRILSVGTPPNLAEATIAFAIGGFFLLCAAAMATIGVVFSLRARKASA
jgi:hypothetical protein